MRLSAFLGLKTNLQIYHWGLDRLPCFVSMYYVLPSGAYFEVGLSATKIVHMEMECWWERYVEVEFTTIGPVHHLSQNDVCKARNTNSVVVNISIVHCSTLLVSQDDAQTSDLDRIPSKGLANNEHSKHIDDTFIFFIHRRHLHLSYIEANVCSWPNLSANTRHRRRH